MPILPIPLLLGRFPLSFPLVFACPEPIDPGFNLSPIGYDGGLIQFGTGVMYGCKDHMKFEKDYDLVSENGTCGVDNLWTPPPGGWSPCIKC